MPLIKSAKIKMRQDVGRTKRNERYIKAYKKVLDTVKKGIKKMPAGKQVVKKAELLRKAYKAIDQAVKKKVIHKNKGSRLKAEVARALNK